MVRFPIDNFMLPVYCCHADVFTRRRHPVNLSCLQHYRKNYWLDPEEIVRANRMRNTREDNKGPAKIPRFHPYIASRDFEVVVNWWNTFNSDLSVKNKGQDNAEQYVVLANKYLIPDRGCLANGCCQNGSRYLDVVYVPYSLELHKR